MPKVEGPAFSIGATGTLGNVLTYQRRGSSYAVIRKPVPTGKPTGKQLSNRRNMYRARNAWTALSASDKALWDEKAVGLQGRSGYNLFIKNWFENAPAIDALTYNAGIYGMGYYQ